MTLSELLIYDPIIVQCHDNPDGDALGSGFALYEYFCSRGKHVRFIYSGRNQVQKSNLVLMIEHLDIPIEYVEPGTELFDPDSNGLLVTCDCQYGAGNVTKFPAPHAAIIDHHQIEITDVALSEIRSNYGSCSTVVWAMMKDDGFDFKGKKLLGTALYYGIFTDSNQFSELNNPVDRDMIDDVECLQNLIRMFKNSNMSLKELEIAGIGLIRHIMNEQYHYAIIRTEPCDPNVLGFISDLLLQVDSVYTCVVYNELPDGIKFSVRSCVKEVRASELAEYLAKGIGSGGGHIEKAGGFISRSKYEQAFPNIHTEGFFGQQLNSYFNETDIIYTKESVPDLSQAQVYYKKPLELGYVKISDLLAKNTPITIRTLEGDIDQNVDDNFYIMIGIKGDVYPIKVDRFNASYKPLNKKFTLETEYSPTVKNRLTGETLKIVDYASSCVSTGTTHIHAREISRITKIFTYWDEERYMLGKPGDFIACRCDDPNDVYIIERDIFFKTYDIDFDNRCN